jgi:hypothetical protein
MEKTMNKFNIERTWYPDYWIDYSYLGETDDFLEFERELSPEGSAGTVFWLPCGAGNGLAERNGLADRFGLPGYQGSLPFLLDEEQAEAFLNNQPGEIGENELLLGLMAGLPQIGKMRGIAADAGDRPILEVSLERLIAGFGWLNREEAVLETARYAMYRFGRPEAAGILKGHLESRGFNIDILLAWSALVWDESVLNSTEKPLEDLQRLLPRFATEIRESGRDNWLSLIRLAILIFYGYGSKMREAGFAGKLLERITDPHYRMLADWLLDLEEPSLKHLQKLRTAPGDHLKGFDWSFGSKPQLPGYRHTRLIYPRSPITDMIRYEYYPGSTTRYEAFGVEESDVEETAAGLLKQAERYYQLNPDTPFLTVMTLQRILKNSPKAGGILMALALEGLQCRVDPRIEELRQESNQRCQAAVEPAGNP